jgi:hypothetical protein
MSGEGHEFFSSDFLLDSVVVWTYLIRDKDPPALQANKSKICSMPEREARTSSVIY